MEMRRAGGIGLKTENYNCIGLGTEDYNLLQGRSCVSLCNITNESSLLRCLTNNDLIVRIDASNNLMIINPR